jgi:hypothetical protein
MYPQILAQLTEMLQLLVLNVMIKFSIPPLSVCDFLMTFHFVYLKKIIVPLYVENALKIN